jgi:hypothetical protein
MPPAVISMVPAAARVNAKSTVLRSPAASATRGHPDVVWQDPGSGASQVSFLNGPQGRLS